MNWIDYAFILIAFIAAAGIKGLTGIGFSTSCLSIMALRFDLKVAIPIVIFPSIVSNLAVMIRAGRFRHAVNRFWPFYIASVPGLLLGLSILLTIDVNVAKAVLGLILITYTSWALSNAVFVLSKKWERNLKIPSGFLTGFINGLTGSQVMPSLPYLLALNIGKNDFIQTINISFTLSSFIMLIGMNYSGLLSAATSTLAILGIVPVLITLSLANRLQKRLSGTSHRRLVLLFLLLTGLILIVKAMIYSL